MSCGGSIMRTSFQPLAHLVDAAAEKWLAAENAPEPDKQATRDEIARSFQIGVNSRLTFHGIRYLLSVTRTGDDSPGYAEQYLIEVHEIAQNN